MGQGYTARRPGARNAVHACAPNVAARQGQLLQGAGQPTRVLGYPAACHSGRSTKDARHGVRGGARREGGQGGKCGAAAAAPCLRCHAMRRMSRVHKGRVLLVPSQPSWPAPPTTPALTIGKVSVAQVQARERQLQYLIGDTQPVAVHDRQVLQGREKVANTCVAVHNSAQKARAGRHGPPPWAPRRRQVCDLIGVTTPCGRRARVALAGCERAASQQRARRSGTVQGARLAAACVARGLGCAAGAAAGDGGSMPSLTLSASRLAST